MIFIIIQTYFIQVLFKIELIAMCYEGTIHIFVLSHAHSIPKGNLLESKELGCKTDALKENGLTKSGFTN